MREILIQYLATRYLLDIARETWVFLAGVHVGSECQESPEEPCCGRIACGRSRKFRENHEHVPFDTWPEHGFSENGGKTAWSSVLFASRSSAGRGEPASS